MTRVANEDGKCVICNYYAGDICENCDMFVCEEHKILVSFQEPATNAKLFCVRCKK